MKMASAEIFPEAQLLVWADVPGGSITVESRLTGFRVFLAHSFFDAATMGEPHPPATPLLCSRRTFIQKFSCWNRRTISVIRSKLMPSNPIPKVETHRARRNTLGGGAERRDATRRSAKEYPTKSILSHAWPGDCWIVAAISEKKRYPSAGSRPTEHPSPAWEWLGVGGEAARSVAVSGE